MFGYVVCNQKELKLREYEEYRSYYCGLCKILKKRYGRFGQMTLSFDTTFLILLLTGLYDTETLVTTERCLIHPAQKHITRVNGFTEYAADMNIILSYYSCLDDWEDEHRLKGLALSALLKGKEKKAGVNYGYKDAVIRDRLMKLRECEAAQCGDIDQVSGLFGDIMAEILAVREDEWEDSLRRMGFFLGKFIYIMDAFEDLDKDRASGSYNPLLHMDLPDDPDAFCLNMLTMMMAECCKTFESLPILENADILRNILYSGIWSRYNEICRKKKASEADKL